MKTAVDALDYLVTAVVYRKGSVPNHVSDVIEEIQTNRDDIMAYNSLMSAINSDDTTAIEYFNREAESGAPTRII